MKQHENDVRFLEWRAPFDAVSFKAETFPRFLEGKAAYFTDSYRDCTFILRDNTLHFSDTLEGGGYIGKHKAAGAASVKNRSQPLPICGRIEQSESFRRSILCHLL